jgi:hypothetical protein
VAVTVTVAVAVRVAVGADGGPIDAIATTGMNVGWHSFTSRKKIETA